MSKLTLDEAIKHCLEVAEENEELSSKFDEWDEWEEADANNCRECAADHRQLAEWLMELKDLREENNVLTQECDRLIKEKGELLSKVSGGDVLRICQLEEQLEEAKQLLKAAVEDFAFVSENFINNMDSFCSMYNHISGCAKGCPISGSDDYGRCKWRYTDEALKLLNDEK